MVTCLIWDEIKVEMLPPKGEASKHKNDNHLWSFQMHKTMKQLLPAQNTTPAPFLPH